MRTHRAEGGRLDPVARRRLIGAALGVLAVVLLGITFLLFVHMVGTALSQDIPEEGAEEALLIGFLAAGAGFLASLVGAIVVLASARRPPGEGPGAQTPKARPWSVALGALGFIAALWLAQGFIFWNMGAASGGEAPLGSIVLILSLLGFATVFAGGLAAFAMRPGRPFVARVAATAVGLYGAAAVLAHVFGQGF